MSYVAEAEAVMLTALAGVVPPMPFLTNRVICILLSVMLHLQHTYQLYFDILSGIIQHGAAVLAEIPRAKHFDKNK